MKEYISVGKNVDLAIDDGLLHLGLSREDVDIKILETGGLFKKAKVCLIYEDKQELVKVEPETNNVISEDIAEQHQIEEKQEEKLEPTTVTEIKEEIGESLSVKSEETKKIIKDNVSPDDLVKRVGNFIVALAKKMNIEVTVENDIDDNDINFRVSGQNVGKLIGYRGETMNAIQTLLGGLKRSGEGKYRVYIDIENYKKVREQTIVDLANKMADKAEEIERNVHLEPMNPYERRIVHSALQNRELVETESMGEGEKRHVVIKFKR